MQTIENLKVVFLLGPLPKETYLHYAQVARNEGYPYIAQIFENSAEGLDPCDLNGKRDWPLKLMHFD